MLKRCDMELSSGISSQTRSIIGHIQVEAKKVLDRWNRPLVV
jgi:hypothetical protein